ncbi:L,D-transpeptidase family protein [Thioalkalivibrio sp. XN8]|uniref:L,D-transpeptidase family protein n=1 Tax=Thioalkalivibrio sp. XN8 TaxID=2712863 RepID=UPI0013E9DF64|nr:L,D-transpeptidase family protein [Thioalkalivibrio sp. XN8]
MTKALPGAVHHIGATRQVAGQPIADPGLLEALYARRDYRPAWDQAGRLEALLGSIRDSALHGLHPGDYHLGRLEALSAARSELSDRIALEILATDAAARLAGHLAFGKVDPQKFHPSWNFDHRLDDVQRLALLAELLDAPDVRRALAALAPDSDYYRALQAHLADYRELAARGGWPQVPPGPSLHPGDTSPRVPLLRARLAAGGDPGAVRVPAEPMSFDEELEAAVRRFQARHELEVDGIVGRRTLAALNVPADARVDQLRVNLERVRWVFRDLESRFLLVNIARFRVLLLEDREIRWSTRAVVGRPYRQTPVFRATMTHLELNPAWTVPPTIFAQDLLPDIRRDPGVLARRQMTVFDWDGRPIDPWAVDWRQVDGRHPPYFVRQAPGPTNPLGRIKFLYPNPHQVYMHDTPQGELFRRAQRSFSSGCIRLERPFELAQLLLEGNEAELARMAAAVRSGDTTTIVLPRPIPVLTLYGTAVPDADGIHFTGDVYGRDPPVLRALDAPFAGAAAGADKYP